MRILSIAAAAPSQPVEVCEILLVPPPAGEVVCL
jgi:hypothetical protein